MLLFLGPIFMQGPIGILIGVAVYMVGHIIGFIHGRSTER